MKNLLIFGATVVTLAAWAVPAQAQIIYEDNFGYITTDIAGNAPDTADLSSAKWSSGFASGHGAYSSAGTGTVTVAASSYPYSGYYLPVNNVSADTLSASQSFTLAMTFKPASDGSGGGIALATGPLSGYQSFNNAALVAISVNNGDISLSGTLVGSTQYLYAYGSTSATTLDINYNSSLGTITFTENGNAVLNTNATGHPVESYAVTSAQIQSLKDVTFGLFGGSGVPQTIGVAPFELSEAASASVPEPSTYAMLISGAIILGALRLRRRERSV